jgi:hypothetical protein
MKWLMQLLAMLIPKMFKELVKKEPKSMEVGHSDGETENRLKDKIDETWS